MKIRTLILILLPLLLLSSCDMVHEWPQEPGVDPTEIKVLLNITTQVDFAGQHILTKGPIVSSEEEYEKYDRRFVVEIRNGEYDDNIVKSFIINREAQDLKPLSIETILNARKYKVVVWCDYILKGTSKDLFYNCGDGTQLNSIHVPSRDKYTAGTDYKDGQHYLSELDLTKFADKWFAADTVDILLQRPMAKITFLATDIAKYAEYEGYEGSLEELAKSMTIEMSYNGYFPTGFNAVTGRLNDAEVGFGFQNKAEYPREFEGKDYTYIGSDYVFVNGESSSVTVSAVIRDKNGKIVNEFNPIVVPIFKNIETIVTDKFFTKEYVPGVGINPEFDGEFNIYV